MDKNIYLVKCFRLIKYFVPVTLQVLPDCTYVEQNSKTIFRSLTQDQLKDLRAFVVPGTQLIPGHAVSKVTTAYL